MSSLVENPKNDIVDGPFGSNLKRSDFHSSGVPVLKIQNIKPNKIHIKNMDYVTTLKAATLERHSFVTGDIVMTKLGAPLGVSAIVGDELPEGIIVADLVRIRPGNVNTKFLCYQLNSPSISKFINDSQKGTTRPRVNIQTVRNLPIVVPPIEEQNRIVETLEKHLSRLDKALADLQVAATSSHHLFLAALEKAIEECHMTFYQPLQDCLKFIDEKKKVQRGWSPQCLSHPQSDPTAWAVLKTTAIQKMRYEPQHNKELPKSLQPKTHLEVQDGDFLMTTTGPRNRCGVVCLVTRTPKRLIFSGKILRFQPDSAKLLPNWLELVLASHRYQKQLDRLKVGSSDSSVSIGNAQVLELMVPVPSLEKQRKLVDDLEQVKALAERFGMEIEQEARKFGELRRALLHAAFSGNLGSE